uniref:Uncharacterized protein n=1 Tax=Utricularia reniformis TaxID=192314 RepID=A0A1Y0B111_9LAMI|nr:hypothetical protein AEK19_MT0828 [Utricularia reniformis]YP_009382310.1 hypothetical protein AEK19_MT1882 [Utricularia reniformis]ART31061.1 hypothetical protein AEK19_MT0828 [Utricularia reniformis]ART32051.1 hypothetical protein AEK19_MT1882 [Utricularia reniformis]
MAAILLSGWAWGLARQQELRMELRMLFPRP